MLTGGVSVTFMQAGVKVLSDELHPFIITFFRAFLVLIILMPVIFHSGVSVLATSSVKLQVIRGLVGGSGMVCIHRAKPYITGRSDNPAFYRAYFYHCDVCAVSIREGRDQTLAGDYRRLLRYAGCYAAGCLYQLWSFTIDMLSGMGVILLIAKKLTQKDNVLSITFWQAAACLLPLFWG